jgi:Protein of unknown function (DUF3040)
VPLSEDEQRILQEIEQQLYASDPQLVREVSATTVYRHAGRNLKWALLGFIAGMVLMVLTFDQSLILGGAGFFVMLGCAVLFERNLRRMGRAGWRDWGGSAAAGNMRERLDSMKGRLRDRLRRDDDH